MGAKCININWYAQYYNVAYCNWGGYLVVGRTVHLVVTCANFDLLAVDRCYLQALGYCYSKVDQEHKVHYYNYLRACYSDLLEVVVDLRRKFVIDIAPII